MKFIALNPRDRLNEPYVEINVTSQSEDWGRALSPFLLGPVITINGPAKNVENAWQYSKIYEKHWDAEENKPRPEYWTWRNEGFNNWRGERYPFGKDNQKYVVGTWIGKENEPGKLIDYIKAKETLYIPTYQQALRNSRFYGTFIKFIADAYHTDTNLVFRDFDVFNHYEKNMTLEQILHSPDHKYGHGFILITEAERFLKSQEIDFSSFEKILTDISQG